MIQWTQDFATGAAEIDGQHKEIFQGIDALLDAAGKGEDCGEIAQVMYNNGGKPMNPIDRIGEEIIVCDGATGTMIHSRGLPRGMCPEAWNLQRPDVVEWVHRQYVEAGAQVVETNTFGATPVRLSHYGLGDRVKEVNLAAVRCARSAAGDRALVAGSIGPLGVMMAPIGDFPFDGAYEEFSAQAAALAEDPPDILIIETIGDLNEMRAAMLACADHAPGIGVVAQMTLDPNGRTYTGTDPVTAGIVLQSMGARVVGFNCSTGPELLVAPVEKISSVARVPVSVQPNAGIPVLQPDGSTTFPMGPGEFASYGARLVAAGATVLGGCCGTTPEHIRLLRAAVSGLKPRAEAGPLGRVFALASRTQPLFVTADSRPVLVGARIDSSARDEIAAEIGSGSYSLVRKEAREQVRAGAQALLVAVGSEHGGPGGLAGAVNAVQQSSRVPVCIQPGSVAALDAALKAFVGKALVRAFTLERGAREMLAVARRYGAAVIGRTVGDDGPASSVEECVRMARDLVAMAGSQGIPAWDVVVEPVLACDGEQGGRPEEVVAAIRAVGGGVGCGTCIAIGASAGAAEGRRALGAGWARAAAAAGVDLVFADPLDEEVSSAVRSGAKS